MLSSHTVGFQRPDNSNLANLTPGLCSSSWSCYISPINLLRGGVYFILKTFKMKYSVLISMLKYRIGLKNKSFKSNAGHVQNQFFS